MRNYIPVTVGETVYTLVVYEGPDKFFTVYAVDGDRDHPLVDCHADEWGNYDDDLYETLRDLAFPESANE